MSDYRIGVYIKSLIIGVLIAAILTFLTFAFLLPEDNIPMAFKVLMGYVFYWFVSGYVLAKNVPNILLYFIIKILNTITKVFGRSGFVVALFAPIRICLYIFIIIPYLLVSVIFIILAAIVRPYTIIRIFITTFIHKQNTNEIEA